jgi:hypothetical protein
MTKIDHGRAFVTSLDRIGICVVAGYTKFAIG